MALSWWLAIRHRRSQDGIIISDRLESACRFLAALVAAVVVVLLLHQWKLGQPLIAAHLMVDSAVTRFAAAWPISGTVQHESRLTKMFAELPTDFEPACGSLQELDADAFELSGDQLFLADMRIAEDSILWWQTVPGGIALRVQSGTLQLSLAAREGSQIIVHDAFDKRQDIVAPAFCTIAVKLHRDQDGTVGLPTVTLRGQDFGRFFQDLPIVEVRTLGLDFDIVEAGPSSLREGRIDFLDTDRAKRLFRGDLPHLTSPTQLDATIMLEGGILSLQAIGPADIVEIGRNSSISDLRPSQVEYLLGETDPVYFLVALTLMPLLGILLDLCLGERPLLHVLGVRQDRRPRASADSDDPGRME